MRPLLLTVLLSCLLGAGACSSGDDLLPGGGPTEVSSEVAVPPATTPTPDISTETAPPGGEVLSIPCPADDEVAIDAVIGDQLDDFAAGDYAAALEHASPGFRATFTPELFEETIIEGFPIVATVRSHVLIDCTIEPTGASATIEVVGEPGVQRLGYILERIDDAWLIGGAFPLGEIQLETV